MSNGFYTAASSMLTSQRKLGVLSNNVSNINTPGFRTQRVVTTTFEQEFLVRLEKGNNAAIGAGSPIQLTENVETDFDPSLIKQTNRIFDLALSSEGYFNVQSVEQTIPENLEDYTEEDIVETRGDSYLTRNGSFDIDEYGYLVLPGIGRVQGRNGDIQLDSTDFVVSQEGDVYEGGDWIDTLKITTPGEGETPQKFGSGMFRLADVENNVNVDSAVVVQNAIEASNLDPNREFTRIMEAQRAFQACSTALKIVDKMNQRASTDIAAI